MRMVVIADNIVVRLGRPEIQKVTGERIHNYANLYKHDYVLF